MTGYATGLLEPHFLAGTPAEGDCVMGKYFSSFTLLAALLVAAPAKADVISAYGYDADVFYGVEVVTVGKTAAGYTTYTVDDQWYVRDLGNGQFAIGVNFDGTNTGDNAYRGVALALTGTWGSPGLLGLFGATGLNAQFLLGRVDVNLALFSSNRYSTL